MPKKYNPPTNTTPPQIQPPPLKSPNKYNPMGLYLLNYGTDNRAIRYAAIVG